MFQHGCTWLLLSLLDCSVAVCGGGGGIAASAVAVAAVDLADNCIVQMLWRFLFGGGVPKVVDSVVAADAVSVADAVEVLLPWSRSLMSNASLLGTCYCY